MTASEILISTDRARMGETLELTFLTEDPECVHTLEVWIGQTQADRFSDLGGSLTWRIPDYTALCPDLRITPCELQLRTYYRGKYLGMRNAVLTLELPEGGRILTDRAVLGRPTVLKLTRVPEAYTLDLALVLGNMSYPFALGHRGETCTWTPPERLADQYPRDRELDGLLRCTTWNGEARIGAADTPVVITVPEDGNLGPKLGKVTLTPVGNGLPEPFCGLYLRGRTGLKVRAEVTAHGSPIEQLRLQAGDQTVTGENLELPVLAAAGDQRVVVTARDQRGFEGRWEGQIRVLPYERPRLIPSGGTAEVICQRSTSGGVLDPRGTFLAIRAGRRYSPVTVDGVDLNRCQLRYRVRTGQGSFGPWQVLLGEDRPEPGVNALLGSVVEDPRTTYTVELSALDRLGLEHRLSFGIMTEAVSFALYDGVDGAAFGMYPEQAHVVDLAPHMTLRVRGKLEVRGESWKELGLTTAVSESGYALGRQAVSSCWFRMSAGNRISVCFNCGLNWAGQPIRVSFLPLPQAMRPACTVRSLCPAMTGTAGVRVDPEGYVTVESLSARGFCGWVDGWIEYYL